MHAHNEPLRMPIHVHVPTLPSQLLVRSSHGNPVSMQIAPFVFGETSPTLVAAKAARNFPCTKRRAQIIYINDNKIAAGHSILVFLLS